MALKSTHSERPASPKTYPRLMLHGATGTVWLVSQQSSFNGFEGVAVGHIPTPPPAPAAGGTSSPVGPVPAVVGTVRPNLSLQGFADFHGSITLQNEE